MFFSITEVLKIYQLFLIIPASAWIIFQLHSLSVDEWISQVVILMLWKSYSSIFFFFALLTWRYKESHIFWKLYAFAVLSGAL